MPLNINEAIQKIKRVGARNVRSVPMQGQPVLDGDYQIEINEGGSWLAIVTGIKKRMAEDIISQATSKLILG